MHSLARTLVTGSNGFVGHALVRELAHRGHDVTAASRHSLQEIAGAANVCISSLDDTTAWRAALPGIDVVIHCAARVHMLHDTEADPLARYREVNVQGTLALARHALEAGVKRFVYVSTVKVHGERTLPGHPITVRSTPEPVEPYAVSKFEAESALRELEAGSRLEVVIVRPPLVYGPGVKANFQRMVQWLSRGVPLPLGLLTANRRSLVGLDNLVDLLVHVSAHPDAGGQTFLVSDDHDLSTAELFYRTAQALGVRARLLAVPPRLLDVGARLMGRTEMWRRLRESLQVDIAHTRDTLQWRPPVSVDEGLRRAVAHRHAPAA